MYLTFDDGPTPGVTDEVLQCLAQFHAKATFFCLGKQAVAYPELMRCLAAESHGLGHHTYSHVAGWRVPWLVYQEEVARGRGAVASAVGFAPRLFRPPYGRFPFGHVRDLVEQDTVVMWDVLTGDYRPEFRTEKQLPRILKQVRPGSILVLHDSIKAGGNVLALLPRLLVELKLRGFRFGVLEPNLLK